MTKIALVVLDLQNGITERVKEEVRSPYLAQVSNTLKAARTAGINIIHVRTCFRPDHPEISSRNFSASRIASFGGALEGDVSVEFAPEVTPIKGDIVVSKRRVSAFSGSDLDVVLRGLAVEKLAIAGVATSGAVLSTVRQAADLDFDITVLSDLCYDTDPEVHRVLVEKVFNRQAHVLSADEWLQAIGTTRG